jgi:D-alanyl-D-alanine carboxypeptidase
VVERHGPSRRRRGFPAVAAVVLLAFGLSGCFGASVSPVAQFDPVDAPLADDLSERLDAVLDQAVALSGSSGGIAGVWAPWAGEWTGASGAASFGEKAPAVRVGDSFRLATLTTEVTCTVLLRLVDAGTVQLDDEVADYVDWIPSLDGITLEQLCRDTSGLADYYPVLRSTFISNPERIWPPNELLSNGLALNRVGPPGEQVRESRTGVLLLAFALERASGRSWADLAAHYVYDPLDMEQTRMPQASVTKHPGVMGAYSAVIAPTGAPDCATLVDDSAQSTSIGGAAAGAISTLEDARTLSEAFATGALLSQKTAKQQWDTIPLGGTAPAWQSAGIGGLQYGPMRGTAGEVPGALTAAFTDPDNGLTVVVSLNNSTPGPDFVRETAFALASIASKADAAEGRKRPLTELPWSVDQAMANMQALGICPKA